MKVASQAERERRAAIIRAQGELSASENLKKAMVNMENGAIALRTLQTIESAGTKAGNTVIFTLPAEVLAGLKKLIK